MRAGHPGPQGEGDRVAASGKPASVPEGAGRGGPTHGEEACHSGCRGLLPGGRGEGPPAWQPGASVSPSVQREWRPCPARAGSSLWSFELRRRSDRLSHTARSLCRAVGSRGEWQGPPGVAAAVRLQPVPLRSNQRRARDFHAEPTERKARLWGRARGPPPRLAHPPCVWGLSFPGKQVSSPQVTAPARRPRGFPEPPFCRRASRREPPQHPTCRRRLGHLAGAAPRGLWGRIAPSRRRFVLTPAAADTSAPC